MRQIQIPRPLFWLVALVGVVLCLRGAVAFGRAFMLPSPELVAFLPAAGLFAAGAFCLRFGRRAVGL